MRFERRLVRAIKRREEAYSFHFCYTREGNFLILEGAYTREGTSAILEGAYTREGTSAILERALSY